ncbi:MAG: DUF416 family protein [Flavisolibacter sp.]
MNHRDFIELLKQQTSTLDYEYSLKFSILICKKLYFDYKRFTEVENWGNADLPMDAINFCQKVLQSPIESINAKILLTEVELITPDTEDFGSELGSYALNASAAVYETLRFILDRDTTHIYNIATYFTDTIDFKIQEQKELNEIEIEKHPAIIEAWNFVIDQTKNGA